MYTSVQCPNQHVLANEGACLLSINMEDYYVGTNTSIAQVTSSASTYMSISYWMIESWIQQPCNNWMGDEIDV